MAAANNLSLIDQSLVLKPLLRDRIGRGGMNRRQALTREAGMAAPDGAFAAFSRGSVA
jgi:hypothetical protein